MWRYRRIYKMELSAMWLYPLSLDTGMNHGVSWGKMWCRAMWLENKELFTRQLCCGLRDFWHILAVCVCVCSFRAGDVFDKNVLWFRVIYLYHTETGLGLRTSSSRCHQGTSWLITRLAKIIYKIIVHKQLKVFPKCMQKFVSIS